MADRTTHIRNAFIIACDASDAAGIGTVIVRNDRIASVMFGPPARVPVTAGAEVVDATGKVLLPGFIDLHYHGETHLLHLLASGLPAAKWGRSSEVRAMLNFLGGSAGAEHWKKVLRSAMFSALRAGVTTLSEFGFPGAEPSLAASLDAYERADIRGMPVLHVQEQLDAVQVSGGGVGRAMVALPHFDDLTTYNIQTTVRFAIEHQLPVVVHCPESSKDTEQTKKNFRKTPIEVLEHFGVLRAECILLHPTIEGPNDVDLIRDSGATVVVAPAAAARKGVDPPPTSVTSVPDLRWAIASDSGPFGHWESMRMLLHPAVADQGHRPSAGAVLQACSLSAAAAAGLAQELGSIETGKKADLQLMRCTDLALRAGLGRVPTEAVIPGLLSSAHGHDVTDVMVNGSFFVRDGTLLTCAEEELTEGMQDVLRAASVGHERDVPPSDRMEGGPKPSAAVEDGLGEEGFRIVRRERSSGPGSVPIIPLDPRREPQTKLPKTVRRVFGDDEP